MRNITREAVQALTGFYNFRKDNTEVRTQGEGNEKQSTMFLHGHRIAEIIAGRVHITTAGWNTTTTKERLNGISGVSVCTKKGQLYLNGNEWDGGWIAL